VAHPYVFLISIREEVNFMENVFPNEDDVFNTHSRYWLNLMEERSRRAAGSSFRNSIASWRRL